MVGTTYGSTTSEEEKNGHHLVTGTNDNDNKNKESDHDPNHHHHTNESVLNFAFFSFVGFLCFQTVFALIAHSQAMLADSAAMGVDAVTYLFNLLAEYFKKRPLSPTEQIMSIQEKRYWAEMRRLRSELFPPTISVITLIYATVVTTRDALNTLNGEVGDEDVSVRIMLIFSSLNLLLDIVNISCFAKAHSSSQEQQQHEEEVGKRRSSIQLISENVESRRQSFSRLSRRLSKHDGIYHNTDNIFSRRESISRLSAISINRLSFLAPPNLHYQESGGHHSHSSNLSSERWSLFIREEGNEEEEEEEDDIYRPRHSVLSTIESGREDDDNDIAAVRVKKPCCSTVATNLNMCSAWTHIAADTLRSIAVLIAAAIATFVPGVQGEVADAVAAIVVSVIILIALIPLIQGLIMTTIEIHTLRKSKPNQ